MPTTDQKSDLLFKKYLGKGSSGTASAYYSEPKDGRSTIYPSQIWAHADQIPIPAAPVVGNVIQVVDLVLTQVPGVSFVNAFFDDNLKDAIPFNFDPSGSYVPTLKKSDNSVIPVGQNDWFLDTEAGMVTFYGGLPSGVGTLTPPKITFWKYIGPKGIGGEASFTSITASFKGDLDGTASFAISSSFAITASYALTASYVKLTIKDCVSGQVEYPTVDNIYYLISNNPMDNHIESIAIALATGTGTASLKVDNIPVNGISNLSLFASELVYQSGDIGGTLIPSGSRLTLELSNMEVGSGRLYWSIGLSRTT